MIANLLLVMSMLFGTPDKAKTEDKPVRDPWWDQCISTVPDESEGFLSAYHQTPTDATMEYRIEVGDVTTDPYQYDVWIAVIDCARIGETATLVTEGGEFSALIFDCAGSAPHSGYDWMVCNRIVAEVDWYFWQQYPDLVHGWAEVDYD